MINKDSTDSFPQKYSNLTRLRSNLEKHYKENLRKKFPYSLVDLRKIAKSGDKGNLILLVEMVVGAILNYHEKHEYISKIRSLEDKIQFELMMFIKEIFKKIDQQEDAEQDLHTLRLENSSLKIQFEEFQASILEISTMNSILIDEKKELTSQVKRMEETLRPKASLQRMPTGKTYIEVQFEMNQKDEEIYELKKTITELEKTKEKLLDELDESESKLNDYVKLNSDYELFKKRVEDLTPYKKKALDLQIENKLIREKLRNYEKDSSTAMYSQAQAKLMKEQLDIVKNECEIVKDTLREKERYIKDLIKSKKEIEDSKNFFENLSKDQKSEINKLKSRTDRENELGSLEEIVNRDNEDQIAKLKELNMKLLMQAGIIAGLNNQHDLVIREKTMIAVDLSKERVFNQNLQQEIEKLTEELELIKREYQISVETNSKLEKKAEKLKLKMNKIRDNTEELIRIQKMLNSFEKEIKQIYQEKQSLYEKTIKLSEECQEKNMKILKLEEEIALNKEEIEKLQKDLQERTLHNISEASESIDSPDPISYSSCFLNDEQVKEINHLKTIIKEKEELISKMNSEKSSVESYYTDMLASKLSATTAKTNEVTEQFTEELQKSNEKIKELENFKDNLFHNWEREMKYVSMIIHEVGLEHYKACIHLSKYKKLRP